MLYPWKGHLTEFVKAFRRGWPTTKGFLWVGFQAVLAIATVLGITLAPWLIGRIDDPVYRTTAWILVIAVVGTLAIALGITPYLGQRRITDDFVVTANQLRAQIDAMQPVVAYRDRQRGHEQDYLRLVIEELDLSQGDGLPADRVRLLLQIDSGLAFDFGPLEIDVFLSVGGAESSIPHRLPGRPNLLAGRRSQFATELLTVHGDGIKEALAGARRAGEGAASVTVRISTLGRDPIYLTYGPRTHRARVPVVKI